MPRAIADAMVAIARDLSDAVGNRSFGDPVSVVYNPLDYARANHEAYLRRWSRPGIDALLLGMNPGPWGMAQTGVPFGEVNAVRDFLLIDEPLKRPDKEHPRRPILGMDCPRSEVSGRRLWGWAQERFGTPEAFFRGLFVWNHCPLCFLEEGGRNRTPEKLPVEERDGLLTACDAALVAVVDVLAPRMVIGIGAWATRRAEAALPGMPIGTILHPSPASPAANRGWAPQAEAQLRALKIELPDQASGGDAEATTLVSSTRM